MAKYVDAFRLVRIFMDFLNYVAYVHAFPMVSHFFGFPELRGHGLLEGV